MASGNPGRAERLLRHRLVDRVYHWLMAAAVLVLLATGFLPVAGLKFPWIDAHWIAGVVLAGAVLFHVVRALFWQEPRSMWVGRRDLRVAAQTARWMLRRRAEPPERPGKYPLLQKLYHHGIALLVLLAVATGILMMAKIDGPFWTRDPYLLPSATWAVIYVLHDFAAMAVLGALMVHVYFAVRPEKRWMTRSMFRGWITGAEYRDHYDPELWRPEAADGSGRNGDAEAPISMDTTEGKAQ